MNVFITFDTKLFIDPLLIQYSKDKLFSEQAYEEYKIFFELIIKLLDSSNNYGDVPWRNAVRIFQFHEISWTCLGFGNNSTKGSGWGPKLINKTLQTAKEIIDLGIKDIDLFMVLALFEEGIGPDRISDMVTNIIMKSLISYNYRMIDKLGISEFTKTYNNKSDKYNLLQNPYNNGKPILMVPADIVRDLPIATDWGEVASVASQNEMIKNQVNLQVGNIWSVKTKKEKEKLRNTVLKKKEAFEEILNLLKNTDRESYDIIEDKNGELFWGDYLLDFVNKFPFDLSFYKNRVLSIDDVYEIVGKIVSQFKFIIEQRGLWKDLWDENQTIHRNEKASQRMFVAISDSYCKANNLALTPEADTGNGPVDFKISQGSNAVVLVEIKLSTNNILKGYQKQLEIYKNAERTKKAYYIVIDIGGLNNKFESLIKFQQVQLKNKEQRTNI